MVNVVSQHFLCKHLKFIFGMFASEELLNKRGEKLIRIVIKAT